MSEHILEVRELGRFFGGNEALKQISLAVSPGEVVALLGPNGAGKSTLMKLIMGLLQPSTGEAWIDGKAWLDYTGRERPVVGFVADGCEPPGGFCLDFLWKLQAEAVPTFDRDFYKELIAEQDLPISTHYGKLSKGQKRWVLTSLALASRPALLLLDEPADGLDTATRRRLYELVRQAANEQETGVLVTTHILPDLERITDTVAILDHGQLLLKGDLEELRETVREVENRGSSYNWPDELTVLTENQTRALLQGRPTTDWDHLLPGLRPSPLDLESLYLALTDSPKESAPCASA